MPTYYTDFKNGLDAAPGDGSSANPWKTLTKALASCANGDTIKMRGSSTANEIYQNVSGHSTAKLNLTIEPDTGHTPVISTSQTVVGWVLSGGFSFTYEAAEPAAMYGGCYNGSEFLITVANVAAVEATESSCYWDNPGNKLYVHIAGGGAPTSIEACNTATGLALTGTGNTVRGITVWYCGTYAIRLTGASNTINGCTIGRMGTWSTHGVLVTNANCSVLDTSITAPLIDSSAHWLIRGDTGVSALTVQDCTLVGAGIGIEFKGGVGHLLADTTIQNTGQQSVFFVGAASGVVRNCSFINAAYGTIRGDAGHTGTVTIHHSLIYFTPIGYVPPGAHMKTGLHIHGLSSTWNMYNNVFAELTADGHGFYVQPDVAGTITLTAKNNAFYHCKYGIFYDTNWAQVTSNLDYNGFHDSVTGDFNANVPVGDRGTHNVAADPQFVDTVTPDYHLLVTSPYRDAGIDVGLPYSGLAPDLGAFEYTVSVSGHRNKYGILSGRIVTS